MPHFDKQTPLSFQPCSNPPPAGFLLLSCNFLLSSPYQELKNTNTSLVQVILLVIISVLLHHLGTLGTCFRPLAYHSALA